VKRDLHVLSLPFREPFVTATGVIGERRIILLRLEDDDGAVGYGEAAPFEPYDGVSVDRVEAVLRGRSREELRQAEAAVEMALLDLDARREERPVGEPGAIAIPVNTTLPAGPAEEVAARAKERLRAGYQCFKLKVGRPDDEERVAAVREAIGSWPALRIDANGAWTVDEAVERIGVLEAHDLELVEQPCATLPELAEVRKRVSAQIAADESITGPDDVRAAAAARACDAVNVKLASCGGIERARAAIRTAGESGIAAYLSSTFDGPWGISAALQLAAGETFQLACGLATLELFDSPLAKLVSPARGGLQPVPEGPGLGIELSDDLLSEALAQERA
jgi:o-succinylbenzoate synthase